MLERVKQPGVPHLEIPNLAMPVPFKRARPPLPAASNPRRVTGRPSRGSGRVLAPLCGATMR
jgi:hypothetical protein